MTSEQTFRKDIELIERIPVISNILDVICQTTGMGFSAIARVTEDSWVTCSVRDDLAFGLQPGDELEIKTTLCNEVRQANKEVVINHVAEDEYYCTHHTPAMYGFQSYISVPIILQDGTFFGTLCALDPKPRIVDTPEIKGMFQLFANLISVHLHSMYEASQSEINREKLNIIIDATQLGTWEFNVETKAVIYSDRFIQIFGFSKESNPTHEELLNRIHPDDRLIRDNAIADAMIKGELHYEARVVHSDGSVHWLDTYGKVFYNELGIPINMIGTVRDSTGEKSFADKLEKTVLQRTQELQVNNEKLENMNSELQSFAYISSHDLQEPLRKIQTFTSIIDEKEQHNLSENGKDYFKRIQNSAHRMQALINDLLAYSRADNHEKKFEAVEIGGIVANVIDDLQEEIVEKAATVKADINGRLNVIPYQFHQLIYNLLSNSIKFSRPDIDPIIEISGKFASGEQLSDQLTAGGNYFHLRISDNGIGFEEQYANKIFGLFQRLHSKAQYSGTGIGLAIVNKIVQNHNGTISAEASLGQGATFDVYIPVN